MYAYLVRTRPDELQNSIQVFNENQAQWQDRTNRINNLQVYVEAVSEQQAQVPRRKYSIPPLGDVLIPPTRPTMASEMGPPEWGGVKPPHRGSYGTAEGTA